MMKVTRPNEQPLTPEDEQNLEKLRVIITWAIADGKVSKAEIDRIKDQMYAKQKVTFHELELVREQVLSRIEAGELEWEWD